MPRFKKVVFALCIGSSLLLSAGCDDREAVKLAAERKQAKERLIVVCSIASIACLFAGTFLGLAARKGRGHGQQ